jgi:hypothetical protein
MREIEAQQKRLDFINGEGLEIDPEATPLEFLSAVYRDTRQPMSRRMKAASDAAQYVHPTFKATAIVHANGSFAERLEKAISRSQAPTKLIETKVIEPIEHDRSELGPKPRPRPNNFIRRI